MWWDCDEVIKARDLVERVFGISIQVHSFACTHTDNNNQSINNICLCVNLAWWTTIPKLLLLLPHMHDHFGGRVRARCCKPFENSFVTTTYGIIEDGFQAQSLH
jgi:hypothetical protein